MTKRSREIALVLLFFGLAAAAKGDDISDLKQQMAEQSKKLQEMQQKLETLEAQQTQQNKTLEETVAKAVENKKIEALPESLKWAQNIRLYGDLRYRHEWIEEDAADLNQNRHRIRARLGLEAKINEDVDVGIRIATSQATSSDKGDPISTNQTLDDAFSKKSIWLDLAYFVWHPESFPEFKLYGGKIENPFYRVGANQLIFDSDLTPEGIAIQYTRPLNGSGLEFFANGGGFYIDETSTNGDGDTSLWGAQAGIKQTFEDKSSILFGASEYCYGNLQGHGPLIGSGFQGNSNAGSLYTNDYDLTEVFGEYGFNMGNTPTSLFASYVKNNAADNDLNTGWLIGGKLGKCKDPGSWELSYDYRDLEADAVLGAFSDSDFIGGGTNGKGHRFGGTYQLAKNLQGALTYFCNEKGNDSHSYNRLQADLIFKF